MQEEQDRLQDEQGRLQDEQDRLHDEQGRMLYDQDRFITALVDKLQWSIFPISDHLFEYIGTQFPPPSAILYGKMSTMENFYILPVRHEVHIPRRY